MLRICFVCMGNICRSPVAEGVFKHLAAQASFACHVESAGTYDGHVGSPPDYRSQQAARAHSIELTNRAQHFQARDFARFDYILALDKSVYADLSYLPHTDAQWHTVRLLRPYDPLANGALDVPDPYYAHDLAPFEAMYAMIERACWALLEELKKEV